MGLMRRATPSGFLGGAVDVANPKISAGWLPIRTPIIRSSVVRWLERNSYLIWTLDRSTRPWDVILGADIWGSAYMQICVLKCASMPLEMRLFVSSQHFGLIITEWWIGRAVCKLCLLLLWRWRSQSHTTPAKTLPRRSVLEYVRYCQWWGLVDTHACMEKTASQGLVCEYKPWLSRGAVAAVAVGELQGLLAS